MKIDKDTFIRLADMAKFEFTRQEEKRLKEDLNKAVDFIDAMNNLDTGNVELFYNVHPVKNVFREDIVTDAWTVKNILSNAPDFRDGYFVVPRTVE